MRLLHLPRPLKRDLHHPSPGRPQNWTYHSPAKSETPSHTESIGTKHPDFTTVLVSVFGPVCDGPARRNGSGQKKSPPRASLGGLGDGAGESRGWTVRDCSERTTRVHRSSQRSRRRWLAIVHRSRGASSRGRWMRTRLGSNRGTMPRRPTSLQT